MPRKFLKRITPSPEKMRNHPQLSKLGSWLTEPKIWYLNRRTVSGAVAIGLFAAFIPTPGQMFIAAFMAILLRVNLPISVMGVFVTNPITIPPMFYFAYKVGAWVLQVPVNTSQFDLSWDWLTHEFLHIWQPFLLGCLICGVASGLLGFCITRGLWRLSVTSSWKKRITKSK